MISSFLDSRSFQVKIDKSLSASVTIPAGVSQGSVLSPFLYSLYTSDLPQPKDCDIGIFADDTAIISSAIRGKVAQKRVQKALGRFQKYFSKWRIKVNPEKFEAIFFTRLRKNAFYPDGNLTASGTEIQ